MRFAPLNFREIGAPDRAAPAQPGLVLIKSLQLSPFGGQAKWSAAKIAIDVPEAPFAQFRRLLFQFSAIGFTTANAVSLTMQPRKNGGAFSGDAGNIMAYQVAAVTAASTSVYLNTTSSTTANLTANGQLSNTQMIRTIDVWIDQYGWDSYLAVGSNSTLATAAMHNGTGSFALGAGRGSPYTANDYAGLELALSAANNMFTTPVYSNNLVVAPIYCDIYGWATK